MSTTVVVMSGDASQLLRELQKIEAGERKVEKTIDDVGKAADNASNQVEKIGKAGRYGQTEMDKLLRELRKTGPEGGAQARALEKHFQEAGTHGRRSVKTILDEIKKIDPEAVKASKSAKGIGNSFGPSVLAKVTGVVGGFVSLGSAISSVNEFLREQEEIMKRALDRQMTLAQAQQEAAKNLAAYSAVERNRLLQEAVPEIARKTGFSDLSQLTLALGTAASSGASPEQAVAAVEAAANVERLTPQNVGMTAAGAVALMNKTGLTDARQAIALLQTAGTQAKIVDPSSMIKEMPAAVGASMSTVPGQSQEEAARQAAALFANITQAGEDVRGASSATFQIDLANRLGKFFRELEKTRVNARSELQTLQNKKNPVEKDFVRMKELETVIPQLESLSDPGTIFGRLQALQSSPDVAREFVGGGFGEQRFRTILDQMVDPNSQFSKGLGQSFNAIQASAKFYQGEVANLQQGTPQAALAYAQSQSQAGLAAQQGFDIQSGGIEAVRQIAKEALTETRSENGLASFAQSMGEFGISRGALSGSNAIDEAIAAIAMLAGRRNAHARFGVTGQEARKIQTIDTAIQALTTIVQQQAINGDYSDSQLQMSARRARVSLNTPSLDRRMDSSLDQSANATEAMLAKVASLLEQQLEASKRTAENTAPANNPPNYSDALNRGADAAGRTSF